MCTKLRPKTWYKSKTLAKVQNKDIRPKTWYKSKTLVELFYQGLRGALQINRPNFAQSAPKNRPEFEEQSGEFSAIFGRILGEKSKIFRRIWGDFWAKNWRIFGAFWAVSTGRISQRFLGETGEFVAITGRILYWANHWGDFGANFHLKASLAPNLSWSEEPLIFCPGILSEEDEIEGKKSIG